MAALPFAVLVTSAALLAAHPGPPFKGQALPRLRGAMVSPNIDAAGLRLLGRDWNANLIRWQLIRHGRPGQPSSLNDYDAWLEGELKMLDAALPVCRESGLHAVVDLHSPPGGKATVSGYVGSDGRLFTDPACQEKFVRLWERIPARYKDAQPIWGYDLANEPVEEFVEDGCDDWPALAERAARAIRAVDATRAIIVEPACWGGPAGLSDLVPLSVSNVVYSVHMYIPHALGEWSGKGRPRSCWNAATGHRNGPGFVVLRPFLSPPLVIVTRFRSKSASDQRSDVTGANPPPR